MITEKEAVLRVEPKQLDSLLHPQFDPAALKAAAVIGRAWPPLRAPPAARWCSPPTKPKRLLKAAR